MSRLVLVMIGIIFLISSVNTAGGSPVGIISLNVSYAPSCVCLHLDLQNKGKAFDMYADDLPWVNSSSLFLIAINARTNELLASRRIIDDPGPEVVTVKQDQELHGDIDIYKRIPGIQQNTVNDDVVLFWSFVLRTKAGNVSGPYSGSIVIERSVG